MKYLISLLLIFCSLNSVLAQEENSCFQHDEYLEFKVKYLSFNTSTASLKVQKEQLNNKEVFHVIGKGESSRFLSFFFKIKDRYESYFDTSTNLPYKFIRNINEGGYTKNVEINFDQPNRKATVIDHKRNKTKVFDTKPNVQDMISSFYYLRNHIDTSTLKEGEAKEITMFFDNENFPFKLKFLGRETIKTKYGKVNCVLFRPLVMADRVFEEEESLTVWISDDSNKIPVKISASLVVGSLTAELSKYSGLKYPFTTY